MNHRTTGSRSGSARGIALAMAFALLSVACGSTVQVGVGPGQDQAAVAPQQLSQEQQQGLTLDPAAPDPMAVGEPGSVAARSSGGSGGGGGGTTSGQQVTPTNPGEPTPGTPTENGGTTPPTTEQRGAYGPGVTDDEIVIGIGIPDEASANGNQTILGIDGVTQGNTERYYDIMAEAINASGGIAGRTLRYSKWRFSTMDGSNVSQLEQSACAYWTQDDPALIVPAITTSANFLGCAKDAGMGTHSSTLSSSDDQTFATFPTHIEISAMSLTRQGRLLADGLEGQQYFDDGYKLGVITYDGPQWKRAVDESLEPALLRHGRKITEKAFMKELQSNEQLGELTAQIQSTVLRFKTTDVTHVVFIDERALLAILFMQSAENQGYRPRYGLTSQAGGTTLAGIAPRGQLDRALGVGWIPSFDVLDSERPENPAADACLKRFEDAGEVPADANNRAVMLGICEAIDFIKAAVEAGLPDLTAASFARGAESLGAFASLNSFANFLAPTRHDGASHYRTMAYDPPCVCFHYTSELIADLP
jgi:hypothetical protein